MSSLHGFGLAQPAMQTMKKLMYWTCLGMLGVILLQMEFLPRIFQRYLAGHSMHVWTELFSKLFNIYCRLIWVVLQCSNVNILFTRFPNLTDTADLFMAGSLIHLPGKDKHNAALSCLAKYKTNPFLQMFLPYNYKSEKNHSQIYLSTVPELVPIWC